MGVLITLCILLLISYIFDLTFSKTKVPSVILLLFLGWLVKQITVLFKINTPDLTAVLPILGTVGLILIVLEGALELQFAPSKVGIIVKSFLGAFISLLGLSFLLAYFLSIFGYYNFLDNVLNSIPLCVISSAIAIPSVRNLSRQEQEFVIYESSFSDILGVLLFNFFELNRTITLGAFANVTFEFVVMLIISIFATLGLAFLLKKIEHHVKYVPIVLLIVLIYAISKIFHLPALVFILIFGLVISNFEDFRNIKLFEKIYSEEFCNETRKFRDLIWEGTFLVRSLFFLLFGFMIETSEAFNLKTLPFALGFLLVVFLFRAVQLKLSRVSLHPLVFVAPRGLITILLFLSISQDRLVPFVNKSFIVQVIVISAFIMMFGIMSYKPESNLETSIVVNDESLMEQTQNTKEKSKKC